MSQRTTMSKHFFLSLTFLSLATGCAAPPTRNAPSKPKLTTAQAANLAALPTLRAGQILTYRRIDQWRNQEIERFSQQLVFEQQGQWTVRWTIESSEDSTRQGSVTDEQMEAATQAFADTKLRGRYEPLHFPLAVGRSWSFEYDYAGKNPVSVKQTARVVGYETVSTPAGRFDALRIEHEGRYEATDGRYRWQGRISETYWYAPSVGRSVRHDYRDTTGKGVTWDQWRDELVHVGSAG